MSLQSNWNTEIPPSTAEVGQALLKETDPYRLVGDKVNDFLGLDDFAHMYSDIGRGGVCPIVLGLVTVFQFLENIPDRVAAEWVVKRLDWKYAVHAPLKWEGFHYSDLCNFRKRLIENKSERLVFENILEWIGSLGFLKRHGRQRTDSTHVLGRVERVSRLELVWETLRVSLRAIKEVASDWYTEVVPAAFHEAYVERHSDWRLSQEEVEVAMRKAGQDGSWLLKHLQESAPDDVKGLEEVKVLTTVWQQQFKPWGKRTVVRETPIEGKDVICSPHDPDARWAKKRRTKWTGYKQHVTETVDEEEDNDRDGGEGQGGGSERVNFITDIEVSAANDADSEVLDEIQERLIERNLKPEEHGVDQGYVSGPNLAHSTERGIELVGPVPSNHGNKPEGYRQTDFTLDLENRKATCPQGRESERWYEYRVPKEPEDSDRREIQVSFGMACQECPVRRQCTSSKNGRTLTINAFYEELSSRRAEQQTEEFKKRLRWRAGVEGTIFGLVHSHGARRARYCGKPKVRLQALFTGAAANLKRLGRAMELRERRRSQLEANVGVSC